MLKDESKSVTSTATNTGGGPADMEEFVRATTKAALELLRPRLSTVSEELTQMLTETESRVRISVAEAVYEELTGNPTPTGVPVRETLSTSKPHAAAAKAGPPYSMPRQTDKEVAANRKRLSRKGDWIIGPAGPGQGVRERRYVKVLEITGHTTPTKGPHKGVRKLTTKLIWTDSPNQVLAKSMLEASMKGDFRLLKKAPH